MKEAWVNFKSKGSMLNGILAQADKATYKGIIRAHGFTGNKDGLANLGRESSKFLCQNDFDVLRFDFRGSGESEGRYEDMTIQEEAADLRAAINFMKDRGYKKIGVIGDSMGGAVTVMAYQDSNIDCMVLWYPTLYLKSTVLKIFLGKGHQKELQEKGYTTYMREDGRKFKIGRAFVEEVMTLDVESRLRQVECPIMIIHGDNDTLVPYKDSVQAMKFIRSPKELVNIQGAEHCFERKRYFTNPDFKLTPQYLRPALEATSRWFKKWLN